MQLWQDGLVAMLAAIGLASLMWMVVRAPPAGPGGPLGRPVPDGRNRALSLRRVAWT